MASHDFYPQLPPDSLRGAGERAERHRLVVGVEQPVKLRAACLHAPGQFRFGKALIVHEGVELTRDHPLNGARGYLFVNAFFFRKSSKDDPMRLFFFI